MTPAEQAQAMIADPAWSWDVNPTKAISNATHHAVDCHILGRAHDPVQAKFWTEVSARLSAAAGEETGGHITDLVAFYNVTICRPVRPHHVTAIP